MIQLSIGNATTFIGIPLIMLQLLMVSAETFASYISTHVNIDCEFKFKRLTPLYLYCLIFKTKDILANKQI